MAKRLRGIEPIVPHYPPDNNRGAYAPLIWYGDDTLNATDGPWYDAVPGSIYIHQQPTTANVYIKRADTGASSDWTSFYNGHLILGNYHLWVDSTGDLRIKSGAPTGDTDGAVVGSQS